jgi:hypothetical protein
MNFFQLPSLERLGAVYAASSYPPLPYWVTQPFYSIFGNDPDVAVLASNTVWLWVLLLATYALGKQVYNRKAGIFAALIVSFYPIIVALERDFWLDLQLTAAVTGALWAMLWVRNFDHRSRAILLGIILGIGTWIKWPFSFFVFAPFLALLYQLHRRSGWTRERLLNLGVCLGLGFILAAGQYLLNLLFLSGDIYNLGNVIRLVTGFAEAAGHPSWYTLDGMIYNFRTLINHQASLFFVLLFLLSLPAFYKPDVRGRFILSLSLLIPYILATLLPVKEQRITVPYLPVIAVITGVGLSKIRRRAHSALALTAVFSLGLIQWWADSWGISSLPDHIYLGSSWVHLAVFEQHYVSSPRDYSLQMGDWRLEEVINAIGQDADVNGIQLPTYVPLIANAPAYNPNTLNYYSELHDADIHFVYVWAWMGNPISLETYPYNYLVWKVGKNIEVEGWDEEDIREAERFLQDRSEDFTLIYQSALPDGSQVQVLRRVNTASSPE